MKTNTIIKKAILSEKAYKLMEKGIYTFLIDTSATKNEVRKQVEALFAVNVRRVNLQPCAFKMKRIGTSRKQTKVGGGKKAVVWLAPDQNIAMFSPKTKKATKSAKRDKNVQKVVAERKEG